MNVRLRYTPPQMDIFFPEVQARHTIIPKGRRFGATHGAANACIEWGIEGMPMLWGDTVSGNIDRYWERYFQPSLRANGIDGHLNTRTRVATIANGYIDFRSADRPENWEGFGYRKIILNEAGIILKDPYLYTNAVRPMMLDHQDSELFALGVPKGKMLKDGTEHPFYTLWQRIGTPGYNGRAYSSYDNPMNSVEDVDALVQDILSTGGAEMVQQEVYGEFIDRVAGNPFAFAFDRLRHVGAVVRRPSDHHFFSLDFNVEPFTAIVSHIWDDAQGHHFHTFAEVALKEASIRGMAAWIREQCPHDHLMRITGDRGGNSRAIGANGSIRLFDELRKELRISDRQFTVPPNPPHLKSREDTNYVLSAHPDVRIAPACTGLIADLQTVEVDRDGGIVKSDRSKQAQQADRLDNYRYTINTYLRRWVDQNRRR